MSSKFQKQVQIKTLEKAAQNPVKSLL